MKSRVHNSNSAIVSLLDQSGKQEKESTELKSQLDKLKAEKAAIESQLKLTKKQLFSKGGPGQQLVSNVNDIGMTNEKETNISSKLKEDSSATNKANDNASKTGSKSIEPSKSDNAVLCDNNLEI